LIACLLFGAQLTVQLLPLSRRSGASEWIRTTAAWLAVLVLVRVSWLFRKNRQPGAQVWWLLSGALLVYAIGQSLESIYNQLAFPETAPLPWWSDLFFLMEYPFYFLVLVLWPGLPTLRQPRLSQSKVVLDSLLLMGAASALCWYFILAPFYLESYQSLAGKATGLAYTVGDLAVLFGLVLTLLRPRRAHQRSLVILLLATSVLLVGDIWFAYLHLQVPFLPGGIQDLCWTLASVLAPLAGVVQLCLAPREAAHFNTRTLAVEDRLPVQRHVRLEVIRFIAPLAAALLTSAIIAIRTIIAPVHPLDPLAPSLVIFGLLVLVLVRQGITVLEREQWWREREEAQGRALTAHASEQAMREANRQLETFLGIVSHELKTPLSAMLLSLQLLQRRKEHPPHARSGTPEGDNTGSEVSQGVLELTLQQLGRLSRLVNDLVDLSRIQTGRLECHAHPVDLKSIVEQVIEEYRQMASDRTICFKGSDELEVLVQADAERIGQVVSNYLSNALKYSPQDRSVEVGIQQEARQGRVWVRDQGPGITPKEQSKVWDRFHRVAGVEVQSGSGIGLGLGLHISQTIIEQHQGQFGVESAPGQGSTFWFTLPLLASEYGLLHEEDVRMRMRPEADE
jgi:signal transduction histidine kinase